MLRAASPSHRSGSSPHRGAASVTQHPSPLAESRVHFQQNSQIAPPKGDLQSKKPSQKDVSPSSQRRLLVAAGGCGEVKYNVTFVYQEDWAYVQSDGTSSVLYKTKAQLQYQDTDWLAELARARPFHHSSS